MSSFNRKEYNAAYYQKTKEKQGKESKKRYAENKDYYKELNKSNRLKWVSNPEVAQRLKEQRKERYEKHKKIICDIQIYYGCMNPNCCWKGNFLPCDLDYHHYDSSLKSMQVSQMASCCLDTIVKEINKCVILCSICHRRHHSGFIVLNESMLCKVSNQNEQVIVLE